MHVRTFFRTRTSPSFSPDFSVQFFSVQLMIDEAMNQS